MWFIFPQLLGLGQSATARFYGIRSVEEALAYLDHPVLGARLRECVETLQELQSPDANKIFGAVDAMKLKSSLTLFLRAGGGPLFGSALERWFGGVTDPATDRILGIANHPPGQNKC
jgi:uncharacterized protein (DUF1810 family)